MKKRAYISVYNKEGIVEFAKELTNKYNYEIISTGGTYSLLRENSIHVVEASKITGFQELLSGKVKSLHPHIFAGILANVNNENEKQEIEENKIYPFDMVVVNLYPFEQYANRDFDLNTVLSKIDIGGVALLRAGAKNFECVSVLTKISDYKLVLKELKEGEISLKTKEELAAKAFGTTANYDSIIAAEFQRLFFHDDMPEFINVGLEKIRELRYGENPHQNAALYKSEETIDYEILNGKELSYNNILDITAALDIISEFYDVFACAIIKHTTPTAVALGKTLEEAYMSAFDADPISAFGGIIAFSSTVDEKIAKHANSVFLEVVIAPDFTPAALEILKAKKNLRIIKLNTPLREYSAYVSKEMKVTPLGVLVQEKDRRELDVATFKTVTAKKPTQEQVEDLIFAWKVAKHVKSNGIVIAKNLKTLGICGGQTNRVGAMEIALSRCTDGSKDAVLASDGFFPAIDNIQVAAQERIAAIIQPGGSIKDNDVIELANKLSIAMITTGIRHFKH